MRFDPIVKALTIDENLDDYSCVIWCCASTMQAFIRQHQLIDRPLKMVNDCLKRNYLGSCSRESAQFLLFVTNSIVDLLRETEREYSPSSLSAIDAMMKICEAKEFADQPYDDMKSNYIEVQNHLSAVKDVAE